MTSRGAALATALLLIALPFAAGCSHAQSSSGDLDVRTGCAVVTARKTTVGAQVVMDVRATGCHAPDGRRLSRDEAVDGLARVAWRSLRLPVDAFHVRTQQPAGSDHGPPPVVISSRELEGRFGPGPPGAVRPVLERGSGEAVWILLPIADCVAGLGILWLARRMVRSCVMVIFLRG